MPAADRTQQQPPYLSGKTHLARRLVYRRVRNESRPNTLCVHRLIWRGGSSIEGSGMKVFLIHYVYIDSSGAEARL